MLDSERRIQKLRITSNDETVITSHVNALEDAFRTASFPGLPPHGLILIRRLDLGHFTAAASPMTLSQIIDKKVQSIAGFAVCVDQEEHPGANVVWFSDAIQARYSLLVLLLKNKSPQAWYWQSLIPAWHPAMDLSQSIACIMQTTVDGKPGGSFSTGIIQLLLNDGKVEEIFRVLTSQLAIQFLNEMNLFPQILRANNSTEYHTTDIAQHVSSKWIQIIQRAVNQYGESDPCTFWLAYSAVVSHNPCLENTNQIMRVVIRLINQCNCIAVARSKTEIARHGGEKNKPDTIASNGYSAENPGAIDTRSTLMDLYEGDKELGPFLNNDSSHDLLISDDASEVPNKKSNDDGMAADPIHQMGVDQVQGNNDFHYAGVGFKFSAYSGLSFIIPLLEYIAIQEVLNLNPRLAELNFPARIIKTVASRLGINRLDPVSKIVPEVPIVSDSGLYHFMSPAVWESLIAWPDNDDKTAHRYPLTRDNQCCYITDASKRFLLYVGNADNSHYPKWLHDTCIIDQQGVFVMPTIADLETTMQLLFGKYLRRYARTGLKQLMKREGHVAMTKTHLDILLDPRTSDSRIRIAGLDIDPGWIPWLGKVVQFHYNYDGYTNV